jgi:hypothetical protein
VRSPDAAHPDGQGQLGDLYLPLRLPEKLPGEMMMRMIEARHGPKELFWGIRLGIIKLLAGRAEIAINLQVEGRLIMDRWTPGIIHNVTITHHKLDDPIAVWSSLPKKISMN